MLQTETCSKTLASVKVSEKQGEKKREKKVTVTQARHSNPRPGIKMAYHALTIWATESFSNSVAELKYIQAELQGSSRSRYQAGMSWWGGCGKHKARGTGSDFRHAPDPTVRHYLSQSQWEEIHKEKERGEKKWQWLILHEGCVAVPMESSVLSPWGPRRRVGGSFYILRVGLHQTR